MTNEGIAYRLRDKMEASEKSDARHVFGQRDAAWNDFALYKRDVPNTEKSLWPVLAGQHGKSLWWHVD